MGNFFTSTSEGSTTQIIDSDDCRPRSKTVGTLNEDEKRVRQCMSKMKKLRGYAHLEEEEQLEMAKCLTVKENLLDMYLDKSFVASTRMLTKLAKSQNETVGGGENNNNNSNMSFSSFPEEIPASHNDDMIQDQREDEEERIEMIQMKDEINAQAKYDRQLRDEDFMRIKLVIVENQIGARKTMRRVLSPVMSTFNMSPQFGLFHSALIIGPWYLEWNDSSLVIPRRCYSAAALLAADVDVQIKGKQVKEVINKMADVICRWNAANTYSRYERNCQHFIDEICQAIGVQLNFKGSLSDYLVELRQKGTCELRYTLSPELKQLLNTTDGNKTFHSHKELDDFVNSVLDKNPVYFDTTGKDDWALLKSFDRAFWLRYFKNKRDETWKPHYVLESGLMTSCPFGHPQKNYSIIEDYITYKA